MNRKMVVLLSMILVVAGCEMIRPHKAAASKTQAEAQGGFASDVAFLQSHTDVVILKDRSGKGQVAVLPKLQGRVMTSTASDPTGLSFGWINRELVASGGFIEHMNGFGGEDRFWLGPEGGQFSIFFAQGVEQDFDHWFTPASIDTEPWTLTSKSAHSAKLQKNIQLKNYSGTTFDLRVDREIRVLDRGVALEMLGVTAGPDVAMVAFESNNKVVNTGSQPWAKETGLLSIWILGMFNPSPETTIVVPFKAGAESELGPMVNDTYFGKVPEDRLVVKEKEGVIFFSGDGQHRSKIGLSPQRAMKVAGSYDAANRVLTIVQYDKPEGAVDYVNSMWEKEQKDPFKGDVVNSYNDGPASPGAKPMGPFYELETSSPAAALAPGGSILHTHRTYHFVGEEAQLDGIARATLGVGIAQIKSALP